jgi:D-alanine-D-alanine ligase
VGVLFGGQSGEHEVSLASARSVIETLEASGRYEVLPIGVSRTGQWLARPEAMAILSREAKFTLFGAATGTTDRAGAGPQPPKPTALVPGGQGGSLVSLDQPDAPERVDVVFPVLHGPKGEDGTVQGFLELAGIPYVGCGIAASAVGMDKALMKAVFKAAGLPVAEWLVLRKHAWDRDRQLVSASATGLGFPCFVKPANMGSSVGVTKARNAEELCAGLEAAFRYDTKVIVEQAIDAREIECSVLGNEEPRASVPGEIVPGGEFYDYRAKYLSGDASELIIPAPLERSQTREVQELALRAFRAIDGAGMARVDFLLERGSGRLVVNEVNTIPGFTRISMYAKLWEASGVGYGELLDRLIELALERHQQRRRLETSYVPPER